MKKNECCFFIWLSSGAVIRGAGTSTILPIHQARVSNKHNHTIIFLMHPLSICKMNARVVRACTNAYIHL